MLLTTLHGRRAGLTPEGRLGVLGQPYTATFSAAAGSTNQTRVTVIVRDHEGNAVASVVNMDLWLTDAASGAGYTATVASGTVGAQSGQGTVLGTLTASRALRVQTTAAGTFVLEITDTAKTAFRIAVMVGGAVVVSSALTTGNYG